MFCAHLVAQLQFNYSHALQSLNFSLFFVDIVDFVKFIHASLVIFLYLELSIFKFFLCNFLHMSNVH